MLGVQAVRAVTTRPVVANRTLSDGMDWFARIIVRLATTSVQWTAGRDHPARIFANYRIAPVFAIIVTAVGNSSHATYLPSGFDVPAILAVCAKIDCI
jgi:hypothetical protein